MVSKPIKKHDLLKELKFYELVFLITSMLPLCHHLFQILDHNI